MGFIQRYKNNILLYSLIKFVVIKFNYNGLKEQIQRGINKHS